MERSLLPCRELSQRRRPGSSPGASSAWAVSSSHEESKSSRINAREASKAWAPWKEWVETVVSFGTVRESYSISINGWSPKMPGAGIGGAVFAGRGLEFTSCDPYTLPSKLGYRPMAGLRILVPPIEVRILVPQLQRPSATSDGRFCFCLHLSGSLPRVEGARTEAGKNHFADSTTALAPIRPVFSRNSGYPGS